MTKELKQSDMLIPQIFYLNNCSPVNKNVGDGDTFLFIKKKIICKYFLLYWLGYFSVFTLEHKHTHEQTGGKRSQDLQLRNSDWSRRANREWLTVWLPERTQKQEKEGGKRL